MRLVITLLPLMAMLVACDKQSAQPEQARPSNTASDQVTPTVSTTPPPSTPAKIDRSAKGRPTPKVTFEDPDGKSVMLSQFRGQPVLVNLWATWCAPCIAEMPALDRLAMREKKRFKLVVISQDMAGKRAVDPYFAKAKFQMLEPYLDKQNNLMLALASETLPMTIFYDAAGKEKWRVIGAMDWEGEMARTLIAEGLAE